LAGQPVTADNYVATIAGTFGVPAEAAAGIASVYPLRDYPSPAIAVGALGTDAIFACPALTVNNALSRFVPTFGYEFNDENAPQLVPPTSFPHGAAHAYELPYLFRMSDAIVLSPAQQKLATAMRGLWSGFAASGNANWPRYNPATQQLLSLVPPKPVLEQGFASAHKCAFWSQFTASS
jgi:para-nitrobenzyl esterase